LLKGKKVAEAFSQHLISLEKSYRLQILQQVHRLVSEIHGYCIRKC